MLGYTYDVWVFVVEDVCSLSQRMAGYSAKVFFDFRVSTPLCGKGKSTSQSYNFIIRGVRADTVKPIRFTSDEILFWQPVSTTRRLPSPHTPEIDTNYFLLITSEERFSIW